MAVTDTSLQITPPKKADTPFKQTTTQTPGASSATQGTLKQLGDQWGKPLDFGGLPEIQGSWMNPADLASMGRGTAVNAPTSSGPVQAPDLGALPDMPTAGQFQGMGDSLEQATYDRGFNRLSPQFEDRENQLASMLANRGIALGSEAYEREMDRYGRERGDALENLALSSVGAGRAEQDRLTRLASALRGQRFGEEMGVAGFEAGEAARQFGEGLAGSQFQAGDQQRLFNQRMQASQFAGDEASRRLREQMAMRGMSRDELLTQRQQPFNELASILATVQNPTMPQFHQTPQYNMQAPDITGMVQSNYANRLNQYNQGMQNFQNTVMAAAPFILSDARLKEKVRKVGRMSNGLNVYRFKYIWGGPERLGVMAQEVAKVMPDAVKRIGRWLAVDYSKVIPCQS